MLSNIAASIMWIGPLLLVLHSVTGLSSSGIQARATSATKLKSSKSSLSSTTEIIGAAPTLRFPNYRPISPKLQEAWENQRHPMETQEEIGYGICLTEDWRKAWFTYGQDTDDDSTTTTTTTNVDTTNIVDPITGYAKYVIDEIDGTRPADLVGTLYRNGPGKMGVNGQRVAHALDGDGLVLQLVFPETNQNNNDDKADDDAAPVTFQSRFVHTRAFQRELRENRFVGRGTFGTGPMGDTPGRGVNEDPTEPSNWIKVKERAFNMDIKNPANTQVVAFGGKLLTLFEAGLPHRIDPDNLETMCEDDMDGTLPKEKIAVEVPNIPPSFLPDFVGGAAHTAHPQVCPRTGHLVGWHWSDIGSGLKITVTEWSPNDFTQVASRTVVLPSVALAPHDMVLTENYIFLKVNALSMNALDFLSGLKGPAASLKMDGRANVRGFLFSRPTNDEITEPMEVDIPPCFSIHFSHGYEDKTTGNMIAFFSGWPPSDAKDFLGAWGGFAPEFNRIPETYLWRMEIDMKTGKTIDLSIAPGSSNVCAEHCVVHPNFVTKQARNVYATVSNLVGDSSPPCGYSRHRVEDGSTEVLEPGERNNEIDCYFFGSRYFCGEALVVPKHGSDLEQEEQAYLVGLVCDAVRHKTFVAVFDLERPLREGPVCKLWLKSHVPHGLHGCFDPQSNLRTSYFC